MTERLPPSMEVEEGEAAAFGDTDPVVDIAAGNVREKIGAARPVACKRLDAAMLRFRDRLVRLDGTIDGLQRGARAGGHGGADAVRQAVLRFGRHGYLPWGAGDGMGDAQAEAAEAEAGFVVAPQSRHVALVFVHGGIDLAERQFLHVRNRHFEWREGEILLFRLDFDFYIAPVYRMAGDKQAVFEREALWQNDIAVVQRDADERTWLRKQFAFRHFLLDREDVAVAAELQPRMLVLQLEDGLDGRFRLGRVGDVRMQRGLCEGGDFFIGKGAVVDAQIRYKAVMRTAHPTANDDGIVGSENFVPSSCVDELSIDVCLDGGAFEDGCQMDPFFHGDGAEERAGRFAPLFARNVRTMVRAAQAETAVIVGYEEHQASWIPAGEEDVRILPSRFPKRPDGNCRLRRAFKALWRRQFGVGILRIQFQSRAEGAFDPFGVDLHAVQMVRSGVDDAFIDAVVEFPVGGEPVVQVLRIANGRCDGQRDNQRQEFHGASY